LEEAKAKTTLAQAKTQEVANKLQIEQMRINADSGKNTGDGQNLPIEAIKAKAALMDAHTRAKDVDVKHADVALRTKAQDEDRKSEERIATMDLAKEVLAQHAKMAQAQAEMAHDRDMRHSEMAMTAQSEQQRMAFEDRHKSADRDAKSESEGAKIEAQAKAAKAKAKPKGEAKK
jgi:hypothetical protein